MRSDALQKKIVDGFTVSDLSSYVRERVKSDAKVYALKKNVWVEVGRYKLFLLDTYNTPECALIKVLVAKSRMDIDGHILVGDPVTVSDWNMIPGTNLFFDMWFVGDGTFNCVALVVEEYGIEQTKLEDFIDVATNLRPQELIRVAKAILDKKVDWDKDKTKLVGEGCGAEFVFEGFRYKYEEIAEIPTGLYLSFD